MGRRGPKPINLGALNAFAVQSALFLFTLRDGQRGSISKVEPGPYKTMGTGKGKFLMPTSRITVAEIVPLDKRGVRELRPLLRMKAWAFFLPVFPKAEAWKKLKRAHSVKEVRKAARSIRRWVLKLGSTTFIWQDLPSEAEAFLELRRARSVKEVRKATRSIRRRELKFSTMVIWRELTSMIASHARKILRAKRLPNYPKSSRPQSDNKRIVFFAKVLAGLMVGIAPATAIKRLSHWTFPED